MPTLSTGGSSNVARDCPPPALAWGRRPPDPGLDLTARPEPWSTYAEVNDRPRHICVAPLVGTDTVWMAKS